MGREINKLSARRVASISEPGRYSDGGGLYLVVDASGAKRWLMFYRHGGRRREMGLGGLMSVSLAAARERAAETRLKVADGHDPIADRATQVAMPKPAAVTFAEAAELFMKDREETWRSPIHRRQWRQTLEVQAASIWSMSVADVDTTAVLGVLRPMWLKKPETATRLRGRIERVLDAARANGQRAGENPARWRGHLEAILPRAKKLTRGHHAALPYADLPAFVQTLRLRPAAAARALELVILTAARSGEVRGMVWGEVNLKTALWVIPADRMKGGREHRVPLSPRAVEILTERRLDYADSAELVFPNMAGKKHSDMVFTALLKRMDQDEITTHGFRSTFRDWAGDKTDHPREVIEAALAHLVGDEVELAYRRGDALEKRRALMDHWASFAGATLPRSVAT